MLPLDPAIEFTAIRETSCSATMTGALSWIRTSPDKRQVALALFRPDGECEVRHHPAALAQRYVAWSLHLSPIRTTEPEGREWSCRSHLDGESLGHPEWYSMISSIRRSTRCDIANISAATRSRWHDHVPSDRLRGMLLQTGAPIEDRADT